MDTASSILTIKEVAQIPPRRESPPAERSRWKNSRRLLAVVRSVKRPFTVIWKEQAAVGLVWALPSQFETSPWPLKRGGPYGDVLESSSWLYAGIGLVALACCMWKPPKIRSGSFKGPAALGN